MKGLVFQGNFVKLDKEPFTNKEGKELVNYTVGFTRLGGYGKIKFSEDPHLEEGKTYEVQVGVSPFAYKDKTTNEPKLAYSMYHIKNTKPKLIES